MVLLVLLSHHRLDLPGSKEGFPHLVIESGTLFVWKGCSSVQNVTCSACKMSRLILGISMKSWVWLRRTQTHFSTLCLQSMCAVLRDGPIPRNTSWLQIKGRRNELCVSQTLGSVLPRDVYSGWQQMSWAAPFSCALNSTFKGEWCGWKVVGRISLTLTYLILICFIPLFHFNSREQKEEYWK